MIPLSLSLKHPLFSPYCSYNCHSQKTRIQKTILCFRNKRRRYGLERSTKLVLESACIIASRIGILPEPLELLLRELGGSNRGGNGGGFGSWNGFGWGAFDGSKKRRKSKLGFLVILVILGVGLWLVSGKELVIDDVSLGGLGLVLFGLSMDGWRRGAKDWILGFCCCAVLMSFLCKKENLEGCVRYFRTMKLNRRRKWRLVNHPTTYSTMRELTVILSGHEKAVMDVKSRERVYPVNGSICVKKHSHCTIFAASVDMVAKSIERRNDNWFIQTKVPNDLIIQIEEKSFHLHKLPLVSRSGFMNRVVFQNRGYGNLSLQIDNLPGGSKCFELVLKFCYGWKVNLTATNVAPLYCAAHFLEMSDDLEQGNLISKTEDFLSYIIVSSWKDTFRIFKSCESISSWARDLQILKRCSETVAWKVCTNACAYGSEENELYLNVLSESINQMDTNNLSDGWWFEDISFLRIDHFVEVIESIKRKKFQPNLVGSCITHWTVKWLSGLTLRHNNLNQKDLIVQMHEVTTECLIKILPAERNSVSCNFLLHLLKAAHIMKIDSELLHKLERRIALMLDSCKATDLLVKSSASLFDVDIIAKVVEAYVSISLSNTLPRMYAVGRLVDEYLVLVARDENLLAKSFQLLVEVLPKEARICDDNLYRAIDVYLKTHPNLNEEESKNICRVLEYHKLSQDARQHATKNERLPVNIITQFMLLEQVAMLRSFMAAASNNQRPKSQAILRVSKGAGKEWINSQKEIKIMKEDVDMLKFQVGELQQRKVELQKHMNKGVILNGWLCAG